MEGVVLDTLNGSEIYSSYWSREMKQKNKAFIIFIVLILITTLACNISIEGAAPEGVNLELTVTAQALLLQQPAQNSAPAVIAENPTTTFTLAAEATPTTGGSGIVAANFTPTPSTVTVTVSAETNCRTGPSVNFSSKYSLPVGQVAEVIGKNTLTNYWIIKIPGSGSGSTCWLWGKYATVNGNVNGLTEVATPIPPSTATSTFTSVPVLQAPAAPSNLSEQHTCVNGNPPGNHIITGTITWSDNSNNENGFNIYASSTFASGQQPDILIGSASANTTTYAFKLESTLSGVSYLVRVEAFNDTGVSERKPIKITYNCP